MNLPENKVTLQMIDQQIDLRQTRSGHVGFQIWGPMRDFQEKDIDVHHLVENDDEVMLLACCRTDGHETTPSDTHRPFQQSRGGKHVPWDNPVAHIETFEACLSASVPDNSQKSSNT